MIHIWGIYNLQFPEYYKKKCIMHHVQNYNCCTSDAQEKALVGKLLQDTSK